MAVSYAGKSTGSALTSVLRISLRRGLAEASTIRLFFSLFTPGVSRACGRTALCSAIASLKQVANNPVIDYVTAVLLSTNKRNTGKRKV